MLFLEPLEKITNISWNRPFTGSGNENSKPLHVCDATSNVRSFFERAPEWPCDVVCGGETASLSADFEQRIEIVEEEF
jgi:hypothetical protein